MVAIVMFLQRAESNFSFFLFLPILFLYSERKMSSDEFCSSYSTLEVHVPSKIEFLEVLGEGNFGVMLKCQRRVTGQIVAIKFAKSICKEAVKEMATILDRLKGSGEIHDDLHLQNIMMVNHQIRPFIFKLMDFSWAFLRSEATLDMLLQPLHIVSSEVALELPFSEAIDMWALDCVMFAMVYSNALLEGNCLYEIERGYQISSVDKDAQLKSKKTSFLLVRLQQTSTSRTWEQH
ncbi:homeodomain-interacting protein kinase 2-like [Acanthopagrus schlegelii]